jgi:diguanylate cyclase
MNASSLIQKAVQSTETLGTKLEDAEVELEDITDPKKLFSLVAELANATKELGRDGAELRMKLNEASNQISMLKEDLESTRADSLTDSLTQTANREAFDQKITAEITEAKANGTPLCLCMIDADHFKNFNDTHGHRAGDSALQLIASVLKSAVRDHDIVARYGGEEFAIILKGADLKTGLIVAERTRQSLADKKLTKRGTGENLGSITVSIGLAQLSTSDSPDSLVERADSCLYQAKNAGRNCVVTESSIPDQQGDLAACAG